MFQRKYINVLTIKGQLVEIGIFDSIIFIFLSERELKMETNYTFETIEDNYRRKWLDSVYGCGEVLIIPEDVYGITTDALNACDEVKKIWIPKRVREIANDAFSPFESDVEIHCEADEQPDGWWYKETGITTTGFGVNMSFEVLVNSWQGSYIYICDADDKISFINRNTAKVIWGSSIDNLVK